MNIEFFFAFFKHRLCLFITNAFSVEEKGGSRSRCFQIRTAQPAGTVEHTDCISTEG